MFEKKQFLFFLSQILLPDPRTRLRMSHHHVLRLERFPFSYGAHAIVEYPGDQRDRIWSPSMAALLPISTNAHAPPDPTRSATPALAPMYLAPIHVTQVRVRLRICAWWRRYMWRLRRGSTRLRLAHTEVGELSSTSLALCRHPPPPHPRDPPCGCLPTCHLYQAPQHRRRMRLGLRCEGNLSASRRVGNPSATDIDKGNKT
jgi:hypothetical protein